MLWMSFFCLSVFSLVAYDEHDEVRDSMKETISFERMKKEHKDIVFQWLEKEHVKRFWDNSLEHKADIINFIEGRKAPSAYFQGKSEYWVGKIENNLFCFFVTSHLDPKENIHPLYKDFITPFDKAYSLDFMIGDEAYIGKGLAAPALQKFMEFIRIQIDPDVTMFFIDPELNNARAKHVYEKAGFVGIGEIALTESLKTQNLLMVKKVG